MHNIVEELKAVQPDSESELLLHAAGEVSAELLSHQVVIFDKQGQVSPDVMRSVFSRMEQENPLGTYTSTTGRPIRYLSFSLGTETLLEIMQGKNPTLLDTLTKTIKSVPKYVARAQEEIVPELSEKLYSWGEYEEKFGHTDDAVLAVIRHQMSAENRFGIDLREALKYFGNPPNYPKGNLGVEYYKEQDDAYPMLVPLFDIHFDHPPAGDPLEFYKNYDRIYQLHEQEIRKGAKRIDEILSPEDIQTARESRAIVDFVDSVIYQTWGLPRTTISIAAPLFMYEAIRKHYGYYYEGWLGFGPNDELLESIRDACVLEI